MISLPYLTHYRACAAKQKEREDRIKGVPDTFRTPIIQLGREILAQSVSQIVAQVQAGTLDPKDVLAAYTKKSIQAHAVTNCLTEVMIPEAIEWAVNCNKAGPLAGMPVSLKDTTGVAGFDACIGYSAWVGKPILKDSKLVQLLKDAGAVPFVKTNIPITLLSFESNNDVFGRCTNPHGKNYSPGGSSGGEGALLAYGGSRIGIGTDVAGSVRCPSHYCGTYTVKASMHRFPKTGNGTSIPGQIGVPATYSPMTRTLEDLETFWRAIVIMKPWTYDHSCVPIPWREIDLSASKLRFGVLWDDGVVTPSPACRRALQEVVSALEGEGHEVVPIDPPSPYEALKIGSQLLLADAGQDYILWAFPSSKYSQQFVLSSAPGKIVSRPIRTGEWNDPGMVEAFRMLRVPMFIRKFYAWYLRRIRGDEIYAGLVETFHEKTLVQYYDLIAQREGYREKWFDFIKEENLDFILTVPNALPAVPHDGMKEGFKSCGYTFLFNVLDYSAGVLPVTHVDRNLDNLSDFKPRNMVEAGTYRMYDADAMHGLPVGVQVVGKRLEEEKVIAGMRVVEAALAKKGKQYSLLDVDDPLD
ncbi:hypothetical protein NLI96_g9508 [Meripilus lineatus]|uniref:amidase n=1 Tax=Meripilus lineatus TaxID=2056292 RepID=A0AAD5UX07_9APHY|nr:hypothetical protein NLI96_g9508 [Physisporinus lineatus]